MEENYAKKKNTLLIIFMFLLLVFVCLICYIFVYAKQHPKKEYLSPDSIEIKEMVSTEIQVETPKYTEVENDGIITVNKGTEQLSLSIKDNQIYYEDTKIAVMLNDEDINNNIKSIYQNTQDSLILTSDGNLYRMLDNTLTEDNNINVGQILSSQKVSSIVKLEIPTNETYVLNNENKLINIVTLSEYNGVLKELSCDGGVVYVYSDYSIGFEQGMKFTTETGSPIRIGDLFETKLIDDLGNVYDLNFANKTLTTASEGAMTTIAYNKGKDDIYKITMEATTGIYSYTSPYYYTK